MILGAGLAGMPAACEPGKLGYQCQVLEARGFAGGRCQTARKGFTLQELGGEARTCGFDDGQYINHGPWRIPQHHQSTLHYTRLFEVPLEIMVDDNDHAFVYLENAGPLSKQRLRPAQLKSDMRGHVAELLAKSVRNNQLDRASRRHGCDRARLLQARRPPGAPACRGADHPPGRTQRLTVTCKDSVSGKLSAITADYCLCTIPLSVLRNIDSDFSPRFKAAIKSVAYAPVGKIGLHRRSSRPTAPRSTARSPDRNSTHSKGPT